MLPSFMVIFVPWFVARQAHVIIIIIILFLFFPCAYGLYFRIGPITTTSIFTHQVISLDLK
jgi:hypothetical protein